MYSRILILSALQCAACGDADAVRKVLADPKSILDISGGGFENLLKVTANIG